MVNDENSGTLPQCPIMLPNVKECDAREGDSNSKAGNKITTSDL